MDDRRAALLLALLALAGAGVRLALAPATAAAPGVVRLVGLDTPPPRGLSATARAAARLARPLLPGERVDLDRADVTEITRLPRIGPAFASVSSRGASSTARSEGWHGSTACRAWARS